MHDSEPKPTEPIPDLNAGGQPPTQEPVAIEKPGRKIQLPPKWRWIAGGILGLLFMGWLFFGLAMPDVEALKTTNPKDTAMMRYRAEQRAEKGRQAYRNQQWVKLSRVSPLLIQAVLISEDDKFFQHSGFDWDGLSQAFEKNIDKQRIVMGGSTITQQLAKNLYLKPTRNPIRKIREALIARALEQKLSKRRILELYLNIIEWGNDIYGIEAASRHYYQKSAASLNFQEAIRLASVLPNPHRFSPVTDTSRRMRNKRHLIAARMFRRHVISEAEYQQAMNEM
ncbi:monofunctional biosynthetic peptidoglycan transglycosylase [candidate division KSB1 bacterium]|nr:monofunctional biosynthetic peptidoglycan transglycosylase [candidate division KSB1 bacterium]